MRPVKRLSSPRAIEWWGRNGEQKRTRPITPKNGDQPDGKLRHHPHPFFILETPHSWWRELLPPRGALRRSRACQEGRTAWGGKEGRSKEGREEAGTEGRQEGRKGARTEGRKAGRNRRKAGRNAGRAQARKDGEGRKEPKEEGRAKG